MASNLVTSPTIQNLTTALDGLSLRTQLIAENIANVDTPGYKARDLDFAGLLQANATQAAPAQLWQTNPRDLPGTDSSSGVSVSDLQTHIKVDEGSVDPERQLMQLTDTQIRYAVAAQQIQQRFSLIQNAIQDSP